jgi:hypothetical protein
MVYLLQFKVKSLSKTAKITITWSAKFPIAMNYQITSSIIRDCVLWNLSNLQCVMFHTATIFPHSIWRHMTSAVRKQFLHCGCIGSYSQIFAVGSSLVSAQCSNGITRPLCKLLSACLCKEVEELGVTGVRTVERGLVKECPYSSACNTSIGR